MYIIQSFKIFSLGIHVQPLKEKYASKNQKNTHSAEKHCQEWKIIQK